MFVKASIRRVLATAALLAIFALLLRLGVQPPLAADAREPWATITPTRALPPGTRAASLPGQADAAYAPDQVLVKFNPGASASLRNQVQAAYAAPRTAARRLAGLDVTVLQVPPGEVAHTVQALRRTAGVAYAEPNYLVQAQAVIPDDPAWGLQYGPGNIQLPLAWDITTGAATVTIAIIDTGVDLDHPDLASKIWNNPGEVGLDGDGLDKRTNGVDDDSDGFVDDWRGWDFVNLDDEPRDDYGHGTHVAGIAGAASNNALGVAGSSWGARLMPIKVLSSSGFGTYADVAAGMVFAADHGAQVINLSLGGPSPGQVLEDGVDYATSHGTLVVAAAGNNASGPSVLYPAAYANALAVASTDAANNRSSFSNYGPEVDIAAPGSTIYSTFWSTVTGSSYSYMSGTSMAAPHVAGVAALLAGQAQFDSPADIRLALEATALDVGPLGFDWLTGHGLVQAYAALLLDPDSVPPTPEPTPTYTQAPTEPYTRACPPGVGFQWVSAAGGQNAQLHEDDLFVILDLPFEFVFDGYTFTQIYASSNGYLTFGDSATQWSNTSIPNPSAPNMFIAPFWDDLNPKAGGNIYSLVVGSAPNRQFVVEWNAVPRYSASGSGNGEGALTFQAILHETSNDISFQYLSLEGPDATGGSATVGLEFGSGTDGVQHSYNLPLAVREGLAIRFITSDGPTPTPDPDEACFANIYYLPVARRDT